ncbi:MAG TPA: YaiI/YqxD family protein [Egibacteraceae bacterium]|nr:YaiI/YqxD family protein [Egibacteraceae bacterium]
MWIDADALPSEVKEIVLRAARRLSVETVFVANKNVWVGDDPLVSFVRVGEGPDVADTFIVESSSTGDICVTADIRLASRLVEKGLVAIDPRGELYSEESVGERLSIRDFMAGLREAGIQTRGPPPFSAKAKQRFASLLDRTLTRAAREPG